MFMNSLRFVFAAIGAALVGAALPFDGTMIAESILTGAFGANLIALAWVSK